MTVAFNIEIKRTDRKRSVGFSARWPDTMVVSAPKRLDDKALTEMIKSRHAWAERRLNRLSEEYNRLGIPKHYAGGETFPYLGEQYPLTVIASGDRTRPKCRLEGGRFIVEIRLVDADEQPGLVKIAIDKWYRRQAEQVLTDIVERWTSKVGSRPVSVHVRNQRSRWGSCSRKGVINLNWRLILLPPDLLDYVIVHELYHLKRPDHSSRYWALVEKSIPDYKRKRSRLHTYSAYLEAI